MFNLKKNTFTAKIRVFMTNIFMKKKKKKNKFKKPIIFKFQ